MRYFELAVAYADLEANAYLQ